MAPVTRPWIREDGPALCGLFTADPLPSRWLRRRLEWSIQEERRMTDLGSVVIIGGGLAGAKTAEALRERGFEGTVVLAASEHRLPYERPPLSKGYLAGSAPFEEAVVHPADWYSVNSIELFLGCTATAIDRVAHTVTLDDGSSLSYDRLVLATGS